MKSLIKFGTVALVSVIALTAVIGTVAFADSPKSTPAAGDETTGGYMVHRELGVLNTRVAEILGVDEEVLADAFRQAWQEVREELGDFGEGVRPKDLVIARAAEILGIPEAELTAATEQARLELQQEAQERIRERNEERLQNAVDNGTITEEEGNQIREWWQNRPAALDKLRPAERQFGRMGGNGRFGNGLQNSPALESGESTQTSTDI